MELTLTITGTQSEAGTIADVIRGLQGKVQDMTLGVSKVEKVVHTQASAEPPAPAEERTTPAPEGARRRGRPPKAETLEVVPEAPKAPEAPVNDDEEEWLTLQDFRSQAVLWLKANPHLNDGATAVFTKHVGTNSGQLQDVPQSQRRAFLADLAALTPVKNGELPTWG